MVWSSPFSQASQSFWFHLLCLDSEGAKKQAWCSKQKVHFPRVRRILQGIYPHPNKYYENEYEIPNPEGGIPILDQPLEFSYKAPTPPHEEVPATSPDQEIQLDDVIERIERLNQ